MDIASKRNLIFVAKWIVFWSVYACIDIFIVERFFGKSLFSALVENPAYYCGALGIIFTLSTAKFEAHYYQLAKGKGENLHLLFMVYRIAFLVPVFGLTDWRCLLCYLFAFPFFHDGMYCYSYNKIDGKTYPKKWFDHSETSKAFLTKYMTPTVRTILAFVSILCLILKQIFI